MTSMIRSAGASMTMLELVLSAMDRDSWASLVWCGRWASVLTVRSPTMREYSSPPLDEPYAVGGHASVNLADDLLRRADEEPDAVAAERRTSSGWESVTTRQLADDMQAWAWRLVSAGLEHGDRVA